VELQNSGNMLVAGPFTNNSGASVSIGGTSNWIYPGSLVNAGTIAISGNGGGFEAEAGDVDNSGTITVGGSGNTAATVADFNNNAGGSFTVNGTGNVVGAGNTFSNSGTVTLSGSGDALDAATFNNTGGGVTVGAGESMNVTGTFTQSGALSSLKANGTVTVALATINDGMVSGSGKIVGTVNNVGGTFTASDPGLPTILTINGDYTQGTNATLEAFLEGTTPGAGGYSQLVVNGTATLGGTLDVDLVAGSGFMPVPGDQFFLMTFNSFFDVFTDVDLADLPTLPAGENYLLVYNPTNVELEVTGKAPTIPEPSTWLMLGTALLAIAAYGLISAKRA